MDITIDGIVFVGNGKIKISHIKSSYLSMYLVLKF